MVVAEKNSVGVYLRRLGGQGISGIAEKGGGYGFIQGLSRYAHQKRVAGSFIQF